VQELSDPEVPVRSLPWLAIKLAAPFNPTLREMLEMRYLWTSEVHLDNRKLIENLGTEPHTPLREAVHTTLAAMGSL
jgi:nucleoside-diphosphate-sugar epimerase